MVTSEQLHVAASTLRPSRLAEAPDGAVMCLPFSVTSRWQSALRDAGWDWIDIDGESSIADLVARAATPRTTATPSARFRILRELVLRPGLVQSQCATFSRVTQGRVAQVVSSLPTLEVASVARLWLEQYPGAGGLRVEVARSGPLSEQVADIADLRPDLLVSGALAAEHIAAWATPRRTTAYTRDLPSMRALNARGFVEVDGPTDATVVLRVPADSSVFTDLNRATMTVPTAAGDRQRILPLADVLQVCADLDDDLAESPRTLIDAQAALLATLSVAA